MPAQSRDPVSDAALVPTYDSALAAIGFAIGPLLGFANWYYQRRMRVAATDFSMRMYSRGSLSCSPVRR